VEVLADDGHRIGLPERGFASQQAKCGRRQRILIGTPVDVGAHQLFGRRVCHRPDGVVGGRQSADVAHLPGNAEIAQQDSALRTPAIGEQDVGRLDVAVQKSTLMGVVQRRSDGPDDGRHLVEWHAVRVAVLEHLRGVGAVDVVHRDPQPAFELTAIVQAHDVGMPQRRGELGFPVEPDTEFGAGRDGLPKYLQGIEPRQARVLDEIDLAHSPRAEQAPDGVPGERCSVLQRHGRILPTHWACDFRPDDGLEPQSGNAHPRVRPDH
jgi:hypothetical protein